MNECYITFDPFEIISGSDKKWTESYQEAANIVDNQNRSLKAIESYIRSIENISRNKKSSDNIISTTKGDLTKLRTYDQLVSCINRLSKLIQKPEMTSLKNIHQFLLKHKSAYMDSYTHKVEILKLEYESSAYMLIEGVSFMIANYINIEKINGSYKMKLKQGGHRGVISKTIMTLDNELNKSDHLRYMHSLVEVATKSHSNPKPIKESVASDSVLSIINLFNDITTNAVKLLKGGYATVKLIIKSAFGIIPIIRSIIYLRYKKKANMIQALEMQAAFIQLNIDQLNNRTNIDPDQRETIIKKQQAHIEAYLKKAEKLRAELTEVESDTATTLTNDNKEIKTTSQNNPNDDDFSLD